MDPIKSLLNGYQEPKNKAADCLSRLVAPMSTTINKLTASVTDGPAFHTRSCTLKAPETTPTTPVATQPLTPPDSYPTPKSITEDRRHALLQMQ